MKISDTEMTSDLTRHTAELVKLPSPLTGYSWQVTWLPGQHLNRNQAITAMTIAEVARTHADDLADNGSRWWLHIDGWAAELGITGPHAVAEASLPSEDHAATATVAEIRSRECPLCQAAPGEPCQPRPAADHLARWLDAYTAGKLSRAYMAMTVGELVRELVVIDVASSVIGSAR